MAITASTRPTEIPPTVSPENASTTIPALIVTQAISCCFSAANPLPFRIRFTVRAKKYAPPAESRDSATYMAIPPASVPFTSPIASPVASTGAIEISGAKNGCIRSFARSLSVHRIAAAASTAAMYRTGTTTPDGSR